MRQKLQEVFKKNPGLDELKTIAEIHTGKNTENYISLTPNEIAAFKWAPVTSVDVERSFSRYKNILSPDRRNFTFENLKMYVISNNFEQ